MAAALTPTLAGADFDAIFTEVRHPYTLGLVNAEQLRMFHLNVVANRFEHVPILTKTGRNKNQYASQSSSMASVAWAVVSGSRRPAIISGIQPAWRLSCT